MDDEWVDTYCFRPESTEQEISESNPPSQHDKAIDPDSLDLEQNLWRDDPIGWWIIETSTERPGTDVSRSSMESLESYQGRSDSVDERFLPPGPYDEVKQAYMGPQENYQSSYNDWTVAHEEHPEYRFEEPLKQGAPLEITTKPTEWRGTDVPQSFMESLESYQGRSDSVDERFLPPAPYDEVKQADTGPQANYKSSYDEWTVAHGEHPEYRFEEPFRKGASLEVTKKSDVLQSSKKRLKLYQGKINVKKKHPKKEHAKKGLTVDEKLMPLDTSNMTLDEICKKLNCTYSVAHKACGRLQKKFKSKERAYSFNAWTVAHQDRMDLLLKDSLKNVAIHLQASRIEKDFADHRLPKISRRRIKEYIRKTEEWFSHQNINNNDV